MTPLGRAAGVAFLLLVGTRATIDAQSLRFRSVTTGRYMQLRPLVFDSATGTFVSGEREYAAPITEDLEVNAWGLGMTGLRGYGLLRLRGSLGGAQLVWPRYDDHFDLMWGFLELERLKYRLRIGRQQRRSELGLYAFDGALATVRPRPNVRLELYGGRGLARGLLDPYNGSAISAIDPVVPDKGTLLVGASAWYAPTTGTWMSALYQREITTDRTGLISERVAFDGEVAAGRHVVLAGYADADLAMGQWGKARLSALLRLPRGGRIQVAGYRYRPLLPLNTIWGVFSPEGYAGASVSADYAPTRRLTLSASYSFRVYEAAAEETPFEPNLSNRSDMVTAGVSWLVGDYQLSGQYQFLSGYGGGQSGGDVEVAFDRGGRLRLAAFATGFQQAEEFRVAYGTLLGAGTSARARITPGLNLSGQLARYWQTGTKGSRAPDWSQLRGTLSVEIVFGANADRTTGGER